MIFFIKFAWKGGISVENRKIALERVSMVVTFYIKLFHTGADRCNGILMSLLLLVAETIMLKMLKYLICLSFLSLFSPENHLQAYTSRKLQDYKNIHGGDSFMIRKISGRSFFPFSHATLQKHTWMATFLWTYSCKL